MENRQGNLSSLQQQQQTRIVFPAQLGGLAAD